MFFVFLESIVEQYDELKTKNMERKFIPFEVIEKFIVDAMVKAGIPREDAKIIRDVLIQADKFGIDSHGVNRLKSIYLDRIKAGILNRLQNILLLRRDRLQL